MIANAINTFTADPITVIITSTSVHFITYMIANLAVFIPELFSAYENTDMANAAADVGSW